MSHDQWAALIAFAFVTSITPGPNNMMLLASGVNFGVRRTLPHMCGIGFGFAFMIFAIGIGLGRALEAAPWAYRALKWIGAAYLLWLAWGIANAAPPPEPQRRGQGDEAGRSPPNGAGARPMTFFEAAAFQWVNPKAWIMAVSALTTYGGPAPTAPRILAIACVFGLVNWPSVSAWAGFGAALRGFLQEPRRLRAFNLAMALLLVLSLIPIALEG